MLARVHSLLGAVPLGAFLLFHLYQTWPVLAGREQWVDRALHSPSRFWIALWVLVPIALHALLGAIRLRRETPNPLTGARALRAIQAATGALVLAFVIYHLLQVWAEAEGPHASERGAYAALWRSLGQPMELAIYLIGVTAVCFHVAHGLSRTAVTFGLARTPAAVRRCRYGAGALGFALWAALLQLLAQFALGEPLIVVGG
jgi:succinate dehydrogenase/fumarate reductase cytochrome b subunit (b558 family)